MSRLIDADALKRRLIKRREEIASERRYGWEWEYNGLNCAILLTGCEAVENPIRPEPHWIPVTERLPKEDSNYLVSGKWGSGKEAVGDCLFSVEDGYFQTAWNFDVLAWRELPEPYKEVTE